MPLSNHLKIISHHAYCLTGDLSTCVELKTLLNDMHQIPSQANPDFYEHKYEIFTIDDARNLKSLHDTRPIGPTGKKVFIISTHGITIEAQNALLKLLEEPGDYAHFFLIIPSTHILLPTVKSRLLFIENDQHTSAVNPFKSDAEKFLSMSAAKRLDYIKKLVDEISKEKRTRQDAIEFLNAVEVEIYSKNKLRDNKKILESIALVRSYIYDRAPSIKMLLEYVALTK